MNARLYGAFKLRNHYILCDSVRVQNSFIFRTQLFQEERSELKTMYTN